MAKVAFSMKCADDTRRPVDSSCSVLALLALQQRRSSCVAAPPTLPTLPPSSPQAEQIDALRAQQERERQERLRRLGYATPPQAAAAPMEEA